jgi:DNA repair protein RadA/Sms
LRRVSGMERRLAEAARLGFTCAVVPPGVKTVPIGLRAMAADNITAAMKVLTEISNNCVKGGRSEEGQWP